MKNTLKLVVLVVSSLVFSSCYAQSAENLCEAGDAVSCTTLGTDYMRGEGVRQSYSTAKEYFGKACDLENGLGCENYARLNKQGH